MRIAGGYPLGPLTGSPQGLNLLFFFGAAARELALFAAAGFLIGGIDELLVDLGWLVRAVRRLFVFRKRRRATAGLYDLKLPADLRFDGFAQGSIAGIHAQRPFADGQARITKRTEIYPGFTIGAGGGAWAGAQGGAKRVEVGPLLEFRARAGTTGLRITGEYGIM